MKAHAIDQSLNDSIVMSYYLIPPINHHQLTDIFPFDNYNDRLWLAIKVKYKQHHLPLEGLECRNNKSSGQKLH